MIVKPSKPVLIAAVFIPVAATAYGSYFNYKLNKKIRIHEQVMKVNNDAVNDYLAQLNTTLIMRRNP